MSFPDLLPEFAVRMPDLRGRVAANALLADITWFRVGGPAQVLFTPADAADLAYFVENLPQEHPVVVIGLGSNLLVRDGGVPGVVIRLGRGFSQVVVEPGGFMKVEPPVRSLIGWLASRYSATSSICLRISAGSPGVP